MHVIHTNFENFRFNSSTVLGDNLLRWYRLDVDDEGDEFGRGFERDEEKAFMDFILNAPMHFNGRKNYHEIGEDDFIYSSIYDSLPHSSKSRPDRIVLRKKPTLSPSGQITDWCDVVLVQSMGDNHAYNLDFDVVGEFI